MSEQTIQATYNDKEAETSVAGEITYDFGDSAVAAIENYGDEVVLSGFVKSAVILAQGVLRRSIASGLAGEQLQERFADWKPGVTPARVKRDPMAAAVAVFGDKTAEEQTAYIKELQQIVRAAG